MNLADQTLEHDLTAVGKAALDVLPLRPRPGAAPPVVLDARVVTGPGGDSEKTTLSSPRFLESLGYRTVCAYLHPPGDAGFAALRKAAARYGTTPVSVPDRGPWDWRVVTQLLALCRHEQVSIWHGHDHKTNAIGLLLRRFHPMRLVTTVHGRVRHSARSWVSHKLHQLCLSRYERVLCVSDDLIEACANGGVPARKVMLLENAIDSEECARRQSVPDARRKLGLPTTGRLVGAVGRLAAENAFDVLIRAVHTLVRRGLDVRLMILGEGEERANLARLAAELGLRDRVWLPGRQAAARGHFEAMDVFAQSSPREGSPDALLDAMALEVPVVATRVNGVPRLVQDGRNGFLVEPGDRAGLTTALAGLLTNEALRDLFRRAGRRTVEGRYSFPVRMQKLKRIYDELLAG